MSRAAAVRVISLQHVQINIPIDREEEARRFYCNLLGLEELPRPASLSRAGRQGIWLALGGGQELHVYLNPAPAVDPSLTSAHPALVVEGLGVLRERLAHAGCEIEEAVPIEGRERFFTRDPGGNRVEFLAFEA